VRIQSAQVLNPAACIRNAEDIVSYLKKNRVEGWSHQLSRIGIVQQRGGDWINMVRKKIAQIGEFSLYRGDRFITIVGKDEEDRSVGVLASATVLKDGTIKNLRPASYQFGKYEERFGEILRAAETVIKQRIASQTKKRGR
jgi:hypothetical protein